MSEIRKRWQLGPVRVTFSWRSPKSPWGRFGGGWNWKVGVQARGKAVLFSLLIVELIFSWSDK